MNQPIPVVTEKDVKRIALRDFGESQVDLVLSTLGKHNFGPRVCASILKLAAGDVDRMSEAISIALTDSRDVIACAEYPKCFSVDISDSLKKEVVEDDWRQYDEWFNRK